MTKNSVLYCIERGSSGEWALCSDSRGGLRPKTGVASPFCEYRRFPPRADRGSDWMGAIIRLTDRESDT